MKFIIAGSRDLNLKTEDLDDIMTQLKIPVETITEVVSGCARGIDSLGESWAENRPDPLKVTQFPADWDTHGKAAGAIRNKAMGQYADAALIIMKQGGSPGSINMRNHMARMKKPYWVYEVEI